LETAYKIAAVKYSEQRKKPSNGIFLSKVNDFWRFYANFASVSMFEHQKT